MKQWTGEKEETRDSRKLSTRTRVSAERWSESLAYKCLIAEKTMTKKIPLHADIQVSVGV